MKKKINVLFGLTLCFLFFLYSDVKASIRCSYDWNGETIILEKKDNSEFFDKITANIDIKIANGEEIKAEQENTCPSVSFYHGAIVGNKIYSSFKECIHNVPTNGECDDIQGTLITSESSSGNLAGKPQATLIDRSDTVCKYKTGDVYTFTVSAEDGRTYDPKLNCSMDTSSTFSCYLQSDDHSYFYGTEKIKCPTFIYYECDSIWTTGEAEVYKVCHIIGSGGNSDSNSSGIEGIEGDEPYTPLPPIEIETGPLDCDGIFQGPFGDFLKDIWKLIKFAVPILIIALSIVDFIKSLSAHDEAEVKKAANKLVKRLVIGVLIFVLPTIIELLLHMAGIEFGTCNIK